MKKSIFFSIIFSLLLNSIFAQKKLSDSAEVNFNESSNLENSSNSLQIQPENFISSDFLIFADSVPENFSGIWEGDDRLLMFNENFLWCVLKTFYGWYYDRAAEPDFIDKNAHPYDKNDTAFLNIQNILVKFIQLVKNENSCAFELELIFPKLRTSTKIPVAIIDDKIYLDFALKTEFLQNKNFNFDDENFLQGSWSGAANVSGIKVSAPIVKNELTSYYFDEDSIYKIRYWKTDMDFSSENATFTNSFSLLNNSSSKNPPTEENQKTFSVPKHIKSAGNIYTCVPGRSTKIRNVEKLSLPQVEELKNSITINDEKNIIAFGSPYLTKISTDSTVENLLSIVEKANSRRAPNPPLPFPPSNLDWHIDDINRLELNNQIIQAVRKRQKEFYEKYGLGLKF